MTVAPKILAFAGSTRRESWNKKLVRVAADAARASGAEVTVVELNEFPLPLMDEDLEKAEGIPDAAKKFKDLLRAHQGILLSSPEYNGNIPPLVKNLIDWCTRGDSKPFECFASKTCALFAASPGALGGIRMLPLLRSQMAHVQTVVIPEVFGLGHADKAFGPDGKLTDAGTQKKVEAVVSALVERTRKLHG